MASPQYGVSTLVHYGNSDSGTQGGPPAIDSRVFTNLGSILPAPGQRLPKLPLIEKLTPRTVNATSVIAQRKAQVKRIAFTQTRKAKVVASKVVNTAKMRRR